MYMKIAAAYNEGIIHQHFSQCEAFKIYRLENGSVESSVIVEKSKSGYGSNAELLIGEGVHGVICGSIDEVSAQMLQNEFIEVFSDCSGGCDNAVKEFLGTTSECGGNCSKCGGCSI